MRIVIALLLGLAGAAAAQEPFHEVCAACHTTIAEDFQTHKHKAVGIDCNVCHGPSEAHRAASGQAPPDRVAAPHQVAELCGMCHSQQAAGYKQSAHGKLVEAMSKTRAPHCGTCHDVHRVRSLTALQRRCESCHSQRPEACSAEPAETKFELRCANCHAPHAFSAAATAMK